MRAIAESLAAGGIQYSQIYLRFHKIVTLVRVITVSLAAGGIHRYYDSGSYH